MTNTPDFKRKSMKDMPAEFFLPPPTREGLWRETAALVIGCFTFIVVLAILVTLTQGIVVTV